MTANSYQLWLLVLLMQLACTELKSTLLLAGLSNSYAIGYGKVYA
jgi:hypothetical protein